MELLRPWEGECEYSGSMGNSGCARGVISVNWVIILGITGVDVDVDAFDEC